MKITVEVYVRYTPGQSPDLELIDEEEISEEISSAVSGCAGIEDVASVEVTQLKIDVKAR